MLLLQLFKRYTALCIPAFKALEWSLPTHTEPRDVATDGGGREVK